MSEGRSEASGEGPPYRDFDDTAWRKRGIPLKAIEQAHGLDPVPGPLSGKKRSQIDSSGYRHNP